MILPYVPRAYWGFTTITNSKMAPNKVDPKSFDGIDLDELIRQAAESQPEEVDTTRDEQEGIHVTTKGEEIGEEIGEIKESARAKRARLKLADISAGLSSTPREEQTPGYLGMGEKVAFCELPEEVKVIELTFAPMHKASIEKMLTRLNLTRPMNSTDEPIMSPEDEPEEEKGLTSSFHIIPTDANVHALLSIIQERDYRIHITLYDYDNIPVFRINEDIRPIHPRVATESDVDKKIANPPRPKTMDVLRGETSKTTIHKIPTHANPRRFPAIHASEASVLNSQSRPDIRDNKGYVFLIVDINKIADDPLAIHELSEITSRLSKSKDFQFTTDQDGNLVIITPAERAGGVLGGKWAKSIEKATEGKANMYLGYGKTRKKEGAIVIDHYPSREKRERWQSLEPSIYSDSSQAENLSEGRNRTLFQLQFGETEFEDISQVEKVEQEDDERVRMIGRDEKLRELRTLTSQGNIARLIQVDGVAGVGKTTLMEELADEQPSSILVKMDSTGENLSGAALIQFAETTHKVAEKRLDQGVKDKYEGILAQLRDFVNMPDTEKLDIANSDSLSKNIKRTCIDVLKILETVQGAFTLMIDDTHHIDRHSDQHMMDLVYEFLEETDCKVILAQRHEERFKSKAQKTLVTRIGALKGGKISTIRAAARERSEKRKREGTLRSRLARMMGIGQKDEAKEDTTPATKEKNFNVATVKLDGLNFQDPKIAKLYAERFIPEELLIDDQTGEPREIGDWIFELAEGTDLPLVMDDRLMQLAKDRKNFIPRGNVIDVNPQAVRKILTEARETSDIGMLIARRVESLDPATKLAFQCLAILRKPIPSGELASLVRTIQTRRPGAKTSPLELESLRVNDYIAAADNSSPKAFTASTPVKLRFDDIRDAILAEMSDDDKYYIGNFLFTTFEERGEELHPDEKFVLLHLSSSTRTTDKHHEKFWEEYEAQAVTCLQAADAKNAHGRAHQLALTILGTTKADDPQGRMTIIGKEIEALRDRYSSPPEAVKKLVITALMTALATSAELGRYQETLRCLGVLEGLDEKRADLGINMTEAYKHAFTAAYMLNDNGEILRISEKLKSRGSLSPRELFLLDMRVSYKKSAANGDYGIYGAAVKMHDATHKEIVAEGGADYYEFSRLSGRVTLERIISLIGDMGIDEDANLDPALLGENATAHLLLNRNILENLKIRQRRDSRTLSSTDELLMYELVGQINNQLGLYANASEDLDEAWRLSMQMRNYHQAARVALSKCKAEILQATLVIEPPHKIEEEGQDPKFAPGKITKVRQGRELDKNLIRESIQTISEMGIALVDEHDGLEQASGIHFIMRIQRLYLISSLLEAYDDIINPVEDEDTLAVEGLTGLEIAEIRSEIAPYIATAIEDMNTLKEMMDQNEKLKACAESPDGSYSYYTTPSATHIVDCANKLGISTEDLRRDSEFFAPETITSARRHAGKLKNDKIGANRKKKRRLANAEETLAYAA